MRKYKLLLSLILAAVPAFVHPDGFLTYLGHCNLSMGPNLWLGANRKSDNVITPLNFSSNRGNHYTFYFDPSANDKQKIMGFSLNMRFPFYYDYDDFSEYFAIGMGMEGNSQIVDEKNNGILQIIPVIYFNYHLTERWSFFTDAGCSLTAVDQVIGGVGDREVKVSVLSPAFSASLGAKFHIFEYLYLEAGYRFVWASKLQYYTVYHGEEDLGVPKIPPISLSPSSHFSIRIGVGI